MKKTILALTGAAILLTGGVAAAQPYHDRYDHSSSWDRDHRWARDHHWRDRAYYSGWDRRYRYGPAKECQWRFGREVCWYRY